LFKQTKIQKTLFEITVIEKNFKMQSNIIFFFAIEKFITNFVSTSKYFEQKRPLDVKGSSSRDERKTEWLRLKSENFQVKRQTKQYCCC
jgi:hypothetical protein